MKLTPVFHSPNRVTRVCVGSRVALRPARPCDMQEKISPEQGLSGGGGGAAGRKKTRRGSQTTMSVVPCQ